MADKSRRNRRLGNKAGTQPLADSQRWQKGSVTQGDRYGQVGKTRPPGDQQPRIARVTDSPAPQAPTQVNPNQPLPVTPPQSWLEKELGGLIGGVLGWGIWGQIATLVRWDQWPEFTKSPMLWIAVGLTIVPFILAYILDQNTALDWWWSFGIVIGTVAYGTVRYVTKFRLSTWKTIHLCFLGVGLFAYLFFVKEWRLPGTIFVSLGLPFLLSGKLFVVRSNKKAKVYYTADAYKVNFVFSFFEFVLKRRDFSEWLEYLFATSYYADEEGIKSETTYLATYIAGGKTRQTPVIPWKNTGPAEPSPRGLFLEWLDYGWLDVYMEEDKTPRFSWLVRRPYEVQNDVLGLINTYGGRAHH